MRRKRASGFEYSSEGRGADVAVSEPCASFRRPVSAPLIPFIEIEPFHIFGPTTIELFGKVFSVPELSIKPFGALVAIGVWLGSEAIKRAAKRVGMDQEILGSFVVAVLVGGFVGGHVFDTLFYYPEKALRDPLSLLRIWDGQSSFGGFTGAILGALYWKIRHKKKILNFADIVAAGFPVGWVFGRMGCSVAHDHPGRLSDAWFAVQYPGGGRFDLGLYEMLMTIPLAIAFLILAKKPRPTGFYLGIMCTAYAPFRFLLDFMRVQPGDVLPADAQYAGLTPAQWGCMGLFAVGLYFLRYASRQGAASSEAAAAKAELSEQTPSDVPTT